MVLLYDIRGRPQNIFKKMLKIKGGIKMVIFSSVKQSVTTRQVAELYGFAVSRNGMMCCPFHDDRNPSMKVDTRYHCFGCGEDGDVIDFVSKLLGLSLKDAAIRIACDFGISYDGTAYQAPRGSIADRQKAEERFKKAERRCFDVLTDYYKLLREWRRELAPHSHDETPDPRSFEALQNIDYIDYLCDEFISMTKEEKAEFIADNARKVKKLEQKIKHIQSEKS